MKKKIFLAFGLGTVVGAVVTYLIKEKELEEMREIFDDEDYEDYEYEEDFHEELSKEFEEDYPEKTTNEMETAQADIQPESTVTDAEKDKESSITEEK